MPAIEFKTDWVKLAVGPARVQLSPSREIEVALTTPDVLEHRYAHFPTILGGTTETVEVIKGTSLYIRAQSKVEAAQLVDIEIQPEQQA